VQCGDYLGEDDIVRFEDKMAAKAPTGGSAPKRASGRGLSLGPSALQAPEARLK